MMQLLVAFNSSDVISWRSAATMRWTLLLQLALMSQINSAAALLSRRKRYVAFPEGATLSIAICMTSQTILRPSELFTEGINWGISYDLPNNTAVLADVKAPGGGFIGKRRRRRDLYRQMELIMDSMGYNGRECIFRALCETGAMFRQRRNANGLVAEVLRIVFGYPLPEAGSDDEHRQAHVLGRQLRDADECAVRYTRCTFSLIDLALGYYTYNVPSPIS